MYILLIIKSATTDHMQTGRCRAYYDNKGVVIHCNNPIRKLKESQSRSDLVHLCQQLTRDTNINIDYRHVFGHMDTKLNWNMLSLPERLNVVVDEMADKALLASMVNKRFVNPIYPFEEIVLLRKGDKSTGSDKLAILTDVR